MKNLVSIVFVIAIFSICSRADTLKLNIQKIDDIIKIKGKHNQAEGVYKISVPRDDVAISIDKWKMPPFMGLTSWVSFQSGQNIPAMIMGDLVLFEDEVNPLMDVALSKGLQVTALHNHFFFDQPRVYFMHIAGEDTDEALAKAVRACFDRIKEIRENQKSPSTSFNAQSLPQKSSISPKIIEDIFATKGEAKDGMYKLVFGRSISMACGCSVGKDMGVNTWSAFAGSDDNAVVDGDFAVLESELQSVLKSLRGSGINIVAIHHHMVDETPRMLFLHYWGRGKVKNLAQAIKKTLNVPTAKNDKPSTHQSCQNP